MPPGEQPPMPPGERPPKPSPKPKDAPPAPSPDRAPAADQAILFHDRVVEWLELNREYRTLLGDAYIPPRATEKPNTPARTIDAHRTAIAEGRTHDLLVAAQEKTPDARTKAIEARLRALDAEIAALQRRPELRPEVRTRFKEERRMLAIGRELDDLEALADTLDRREFELLKTLKGRVTGADRTMLQDSAHLHEALLARRETLETGPDTALAARLHCLTRYRDQLAKDRFAETPSRTRSLEEIRRLWEEGKNVFLSGPTGTGKTELFIHLAQKLYAAPPEIISGAERVSSAEIFGKTLLRPSGEVGPKKLKQFSDQVERAHTAWKSANPDASPEEVDRAHNRFLQLTAASIGIATETYFQPGAYTMAIDKGRPFVMDEFNLLDPNSRRQLKEKYNRKPGDSVKIQEDTGKSHIIREGFSFGATANIKSEKYKVQFELGPEESRVFEMRRVDYLPKGELYDLTLATLMDKRGGVRLNLRDAHLTLTRLAEAAEMIQGAFLGTQTALYEAGGGTKKKLATLEKAVLDPGRVLGMLQGWPVAEAKGQAFQEYINDHLRDFLNQEDFPEKDRALLLKILITKGFFAGRRPDEFHVPGLKVNDLETWGWKAKPEPAKTDYLRPEIVAQLDPFGVRKGKLALIGAEFLAGAAGDKKPEGERHESALRFTVPDALNPYQEALLEGGVTDPALTAERQDRAIDLAELLESHRAAYEASHLPDWSAALEGIKNDIRLTPEKRQIIEAELKDGAMAILMPGRATEQATTTEQYQKNLKPIWIKDNAPQTIDDAYLWEHTASLIQNQNPKLTEDIPERPYLLLFKPTQAPEARTTNKTLTQQQDELVQINQERQALGQSPAHVIKPIEYAAAQKLFTESTHNESPQPLTDLRPLDSATWTRFIDLPLSSDGDVPYGDFDPGDRQVRFGRDDAADPDAGSGFRLVVRVEL